MKHLLSSLALAIVLLVAASGAWAASITQTVDTFDDPTQIPPTLPGNVAGTSAIHVSSADGSNVLGAFRKLQLANKLGAGSAISGTSATIDDDSSVVIKDQANLNSGVGAGGRVLLRWDGTSTTDLTGNALNVKLLDDDLVDDEVIRVVITNLNRYLLADVTICAGTGAVGVTPGTCFTDVYEKPAPTDINFNPATAPSAPTGIGSGADGADHCLDDCAFAPAGVNFVARARVGTLGILASTADWLALPDATDADVRNTLASAGSLQIVIRISSDPPPGIGGHPQAETNGFDVLIDCVGIFPRSAPLNACPSAVPEPTTISLMGLGLAGLGLGAFLRRRTKA